MATNTSASATAFERHRVETRARLVRTGVPRPGPGSISWKINREVIVVAGWGAAILLQLGHPLVSAGVGEHSSFRGGLGASAKRLRSTVGAMLTLTFGDDEEAISVAAGINVIHDRVFGKLRTAAGVYPSGEAYSAHDADLLRWVHATLLHAIPRTYELLVGPLTPEEHDRYCVEAAVMEPLLDIPTGTLPRSTAELDDYMGDMLASGHIAITPESRALARAALFPPRWQLLWPALRPLQLLTIGSLPARVRQAYGFDWTRSNARALVRWTTALKFVSHLLPRFVRQWPSSRTRKSHDGTTPTHGTSHPQRLEDLP